MNTGATVCQFSLVKGRERFVARCTPGEEEALVAGLMRWAQDDEIDFDWFDAAVLARQITQRLASRTLGDKASRT